ncbi:MAG: glycosyl transferase family 36 [Gammaproteobacteria bacterium]|nr:glycosyl transferase family 36 [Gammaproteobacteria bacterium]
MTTTATTGHTAGASLARLGRYTAVVLLGAASACGASLGHGAASIAGGVALGIATLLLASASVGFRPAARDLARDALALGMLAAGCDPAVAPWHVPAAWSELLRFSPAGTGAAIAFYLGVTGLRTLQLRAGPPWREVLATFACPYLFNGLLVLAAPALVGLLGRHALPGVAVPAGAGDFLGRVLILFVLNASAALVTGYVLDRRGLVSRAAWLILGACALHASAGPLLADLGSSAAFASWPLPARAGIAIAFAAAAQAGLWAETFLVTGFLLDALHGRRPTGAATRRHWRSGLRGGSKYGVVFMVLIELLAFVRGTPLLSASIAHHPLLGGALLGALIFAIGKTVIESSDVSRQFFRRLYVDLCQPVNLLRGVVAGAAVGYAAQRGITGAGDGARFLWGLAGGALAYAGPEWARDAWACFRRERARVQSWRVYSLAALLGGLVGGALCWYFDAAQLAQVAAKLARYGTFNFAAAGGKPSEFVIYPLFSKWGAMDLGAVAGGVRLFYGESLAGVINWSLAAPLFGLNVALLNAMLARSRGPVLRIFTTAGVVEMIEQTVRVLRWGLWMAPVISSFLKMAPNPTWYNQDGAVRSAVAVAKSFTLTPEAFHHWSREIFLGVLSYDWLRVIVWLDHMGLRVATLVNFSMIGVDRLDERAARFLGHAGRTRVIPVGIRRFFTWAPLLIPFYIPRGGDWDYAWGGAERIAHGDFPVLSPVVALLWVYGVAIAIAAAIALWLAWRPARPMDGVARADRLSGYGPAFALANGLCTLRLGPDGRGVMSAERPVAAGGTIDLTRAPEHDLARRGLWLHAREAGRQTTLTAGPCCRYTRPQPDLVRIDNEFEGLACTIRVRLEAEAAVAVWDVELHNATGAPRELELISARELALAPADLYQRQASFNAIHLGSWFHRAQQALWARNRLHAGVHGRVSEELYVHAAAGAEARLTGYQDSRPHFLRGEASLPENGPQLRTPDDEGLLYPFDPMASLAFQLTLAPGARTKLRFIDAYVADEAAAQGLVARLLGLAAPDPVMLRKVLETRRELPPAPRPGHGLPHRYSTDGRELHITPDTPRPWTHVLANPLGYGTIVSNHGEACSFAVNAQQNALSPFTLDAVPAAAPGQAIFVRDLVAGRTYHAAAAPARAADGDYEVVFGLGYCRLEARYPELAITTRLTVLEDAPVELRIVEIENRAAETRRYRVVPYLEFALAELWRDSYGRLEFADTGRSDAVMCRHAANAFAEGWAFFAVSRAPERWERVRGRFVGPGRDLRDPQFVADGWPAPHAGDDGSRIAACAIELDVPAGARERLVVAIGFAPSVEAAGNLIADYVFEENALAAEAATQAAWRRRLGVLRIETNRPDFDRLVNDWLPYQALTSRLWGRLGPNQRSGAFGFRDQLQDVLPFLFLDPALARRQIVRHAGQQFLAGDVFKWWHAAPNGETGLGARTRASDPHLWLPYLVAQYVAATGDRSVLDVERAYIEGPAVPPQLEGITLAPRPTPETASVYDHCRRAIERSLEARGANGLPLLGTGDWNDGLDELGFGGRGESTWMAFFLHRVLRDFAPLAGERGEEAVAARYRLEADALAAACHRMERGAGYVRATSDDGTEFTIDSGLMTSWPALSGAVDHPRAALVMRNGLAALEQERMIRMLVPSFDEHSRPYPGRIALYPPGVRENGGQYSHGVSWIVDAANVLASAATQADEAAEWRATAARVWTKISPLGKTEELGVLGRYELPPHQQAADIYWGAGYTLRGGWPAYTGAAARMLWAAYGMFGIELSTGEFSIAHEAFQPRGEITLAAVTWHGRRHVRATSAV